MHKNGPPYLKVYIAGKVAKDSQFGTHHWRDEFCATLQELSGVKLTNLDPLKAERGTMSYQEIFAKDCQLINQADVCIVYLSDDISIGGSQEILIARYLHKPVIGFAPHGGKFNGAAREMLGETVTNYKDPFVFSTCDVVCGTLQEVAAAVAAADSLHSEGLQIIDTALKTKK
jgi:nucleoside 2-deoxyribosyltransferase